MTSYSVLVHRRITGRRLHNSELDFGSRLHKQLALWKPYAHVSPWNPLGMPSLLVQLLCCRLPLLSFWVLTLFRNLTSVSNRIHTLKLPSSNYFHLMTNTTLTSVYWGHLASGNVYTAQQLLNFFHFNQPPTLLITNTTALHTTQLAENLSQNSG